MAPDHESLSQSVKKLSTVHSPELLMQKGQKSITGRNKQEKIKIK